MTVVLNRFSFHFVSSSNSSHFFEYKAARLAELAIHLGSSDNITVIVVRFFNDEG